MVTPNTPLLLSKKSQAGLLEYSRNCYAILGQNWNIRARMREIDLLYMRENDQTTAHQRAKANNKLGDSTRFQNVTVPIVMPAVEAAVTYQASVFLTGTPVFGVVSNPSNMDAAMQMETVIDDQAVRGGWVSEFLKFFRNGFKYNLSAIEINWARVVTVALETDLAFSTSQAKPREVIWQGNTIKNLDMYNLIFDSRVNPTEMHTKGEFTGYTEVMSRIVLKQFIQELPDKMVDNIVPAFESGLGFSGIANSGENASYYIPTLNPDALLDRNTTSTNWMAWANLAGAEQKIQYKDMYEVTTLYARILPSDFNIRVPSSNTPQVWKFIYVNHSVLIYAERQTNAHGMLPVLMGQPSDDGLGYQTKPLAQNVEPIQSITSAMWNSVIAARRRAISDRGIYDPSRITEAHINNENPSAKIPVRPAAYGKNVQEAYYPIPFRDDQSGLLMQETEQLVRMGNMITGQNPVRQGQFVKGNKTLHEFQSVMSNANGRDQVTAMLLEAQIFTPLKEILKLNILQYQGGTSLYNRNTEQEVTIDPVALRKAVLDFKISDGLTPSDKLISGDTLQVAMQVIGSTPAIAAGYNLAPMFSYFIKTQGGKITEFEKSPAQMAYEQAMAQWQQAMQSMAEGMKGMDPQQMQQMMQKMAPQPQPQQFGYNPAAQGASQAAVPAEQTTRINNITNNIQNTGEQ